MRRINRLVRLCLAKCGCSDFLQGTQQQKTVTTLRRGGKEVLSTGDAQSVPTLPSRPPWAVPLLGLSSVCPTPATPAPPLRAGFPPPTPLQAPPAGVDWR